MKTPKKAGRLPAKPQVTNTQQQPVDPAGRLEPELFILAGHLPAAERIKLATMFREQGATWLRWATQLDSGVGAAFTTPAGSVTHLDLEAIAGHLSTSDRIVMAAKMERWVGELRASVEAMQALRIVGMPPGMARWN